MPPLSCLSLFGPLCVPFLVPAKIVIAAARRRGQGRPYGRRALRVSLDGGEHDRTLATDGIALKPSRLVASAAVSLWLFLTPGSVARGGETASVSPSTRMIVDEAAARFGLPAFWIDAVIAAESGGDERALSVKGAIGLMQLMPETWRAMSARYDLGQDPYDRRDNIMAGAAYLRELYDKYGPRGFLAAYNAGPGRYVDARDGKRRLPRETLTYVAAVEGRISAKGVSSKSPDTPRLRNWRAAALFVENTAGDEAMSSAALFPVHSEQATAR